MKHPSAFTLIELMVVMAIIAILATAGLSAYTGYIKKGRDTARIEIARSIEVAVVSYMGSHNGIAPDGTELETELNNMNLGWILPSQEMRVVTLITETVQGLLGGTTYALPVKDPIGGKNVCLDADEASTQPCRFDYIKYDDGSYSISYGIEHPSSMKKNYYHVTDITHTTATSDDPSPITEKYGVFQGNAVFIGTPVVNATTYTPDLPQGVTMPTNTLTPAKLLNTVVVAPTGGGGGGSSSTTGGATTAAPTTEAPTTTVADCANIGDVCLDGTVYVSDTLRTSVSNESITMTMSVAITHCENKGDGWRLPTLTELITICNNRSSIQNFPVDTPGGYTSTTFSGTTFHTTGINNTCTDWFGGDNSRRVRCVQDA